VSNGAGTVSGDVSNITIQCVDVPLTLTLSVPESSEPAASRSGNLVLQFSAPLNPSVPASAVTLQNAAGVVTSTFAVAADQIVVTPSQRLLPVTAYTLRASTEVRGASGEQLAAPIVVSFTTADGAWSQAHLIEARLGSPSTPRLAMNANGVALAVWDDQDTAYRVLLSNRYTPGTGWELFGADPVAQQLAVSFAGGHLRNAQIALSASNDAVAVWQQDDDGYGSGAASIEANRSNAGSDWDSDDAVLLETDPDYASDAYVVLDAHGNGVAVWAQEDCPCSNPASPARDIWARRYTANGGWGPPVRIETGAHQAADPHVAIDAEGNAIAVWRQHDDTRYSIWANRFVPGAGWIGAVLIEDNHDYHASSPRIAMNARGDAVVVWGDFASYSWANNYAARRGWGEAVLIGSNDDPSQQDLRHRVAIDANGNAIAVWQHHVDLRDNIMVSRYAGGVGWSEAAALEAVDASARSPEIAVDPRGNAIAVWIQQDGARYDAWARRYVAGRGWVDPVLIETDDAGSAANPQIALDPSGNAIAVWGQHDGDRFNIWANRFE
jgi:hypothetical protein